MKKYKLASPFLDIGGGVGDVTEFLIRKELTGKYIDYSEHSFNEASRILKNKNVCVERKDFFQEKDRYSTMICFDVIEHIDNDDEFISHMAELLKSGGFLILVVPVYEHEWRWDDEYYGHFRRYDPDQFIGKMKKNNFIFVERINITFPIFWSIRRVYIKLKKKSEFSKKKDLQTKASAVQNAWDLGFFSRLISIKYLWKPLFLFQRFFSRSVRGHEHMFVFKRGDN